MEANTFQLADGRTMYQYSWNEPRSSYVLTLDDLVNPTSMAYYVWIVDGDWYQVFQESIAKIVGRPVKLVDYYSQGNGHGGCRIEC